MGWQRSIWARWSFCSYCFILLSYYYSYIQYIVNTYEVKSLKKKYEKLSKYNNISEYIIFRSNNDGILKSKTFVDLLYIGDCQFVEDLLKPYNKEFEWNDFFQFVLYFSLAPMPAMAYGIYSYINKYNFSSCEYIKRYK